MPDNNNQVYKQKATTGTAGTEASPKILTNPPFLMQTLLNLYTSFTKETLGSKLLIVLFFILPWNLGKHLEQQFSLIGSMQIPYLVPTIYLQDILIATIVLITVALSLCKACPIAKVGAVTARLFFLFLVAAFLSIFFAGRFYPSVYSFARLFLYFLFFVIATGLFRIPSIRCWFFTSLVVNTLLLSALGIFQFYKQSSVFNNYLFFGEQPYSIYTPYIAKESFGGVSKIPPYATFLHPNIFAGYLVVSLTLSLGYLISLKGRKWLLSGVCIFYILYILLCAFLLFLTKSYTAWVAFVAGFLLLFFIRLSRSVRLMSWMFLLLTVAIILTGLLFPFYSKRALMLLPNDSITSTLSVERRSALLQASYRMFSQKPFFGWGINSFTYSFEPFYNRSDVVRFLQPVHNVYALVAVETGFFGAILYISLIAFSIYRITRNGGWFYSVALLQIVALSSFDHYFFTIPQTQLLSILTLLMGLTYTKDINCL